MDERKRCIDRGPAWIVALCACANLGIHYGIITCGALFYPALMEVTGYPISIVSWLVTGQFAITFCLAPFYNRIMDLVPNRVAVCVAVLVTSGSFIGASFFSNYFVFLGLYTIIGGIGLGISVVRVIAVAVGYFNRYRVIALALCSSGAGFGIFTVSKLGAIMIDAYTWRIAMIGYALINLHAIPLFFIVRPLPLEHIAEPTVVIPEQPDLTKSNLELPKLKVVGGMEQGFFSSLTSVRSCQMIRPFRTSYELLPGGKLVPDLHVIIEFVEAKLDQTEEKIVIDPITVWSNPDPQVTHQIEEAAKDLFGGLNSMTDMGMIPLIFIVDTTHTTDASGRGAIAGKHLKSWLQSRPEMNSLIDMAEADSILFARRFEVAGETFASISVAGYSRKQLRRRIRHLLEQGEQQVEEYTTKLKTRGLVVHPNPIIVLVDQGEFCQLPDVDNEVDAWFIDKSNHRLEQCAGSHANQESPRAKMSLDLPNNVIGSGHFINVISPNKKKFSKYLPGELLSNFKIPIEQRFPRIRGETVRARDTRLIQSTAELRRASMTPVFNQTVHDNTSSVMSVCNSRNPLNRIISKLETDRKIDGSGTIGRKYKKRLLLANPLFLSFLLSRSLVYITDSIVYGHLSNFGLDLNFYPKQAANLLSFIGFTSMFARVGTGLVAHFAPKMKHDVLTAVCLCFLGLHAILMPWFPCYTSLAAFAISYGLLVSPSFAFAPTMAYDIIGAHQYDEAVSYLFQFEAIGFLLGGPMGGAVKELQNQYKDCFYLAGVSCLLGAAILGLQAIVLASRYRKHRKQTVDALLVLEESRHNSLMGTGKMRKSLPSNHVPIKIHIDNGIL